MKTQAMVYREFENYIKSKASITDTKTIRKAFTKVVDAMYESVDCTQNNNDIKMSFRKYLTEIPQQEHFCFMPTIATSFASRHYLAIKDFVKSLELINEYEMKAQDKIAYEFEAQRELFKDDYEYGDLKGEVRIYSDSIIVEAFGWQEDFIKSRLPKGGKYIGKGQWEFPIDMKSTFITETGFYSEMPVLVKN